MLRSDISKIDHKFNLLAQDAFQPCARRAVLGKRIGRLGKKTS